MECDADEETEVDDEGEEDRLEESAREDMLSVGDEGSGCRG